MNLWVVVHKNPVMKSRGKFAEMERIIEGHGPMGSNTKLIEESAMQKE